MTPLKAPEGYSAEILDDGEHYSLRVVDAAGKEYLRHGYSSKKSAQSRLGWLRSEMAKLRGDHAAEAALLARVLSRRVDRTKEQSSVTLVLPRWAKQELNKRAKAKGLSRHAYMRALILADFIEPIQC